VIDHAFLLYGSQALVGAQLESFRKFPPRQKPASFNLDRILDQLTDAGGGGMH
jgi:hypothetical protein